VFSVVCNTSSQDRLTNWHLSKQLVYVNVKIFLLKQEDDVLASSLLLLVNVETTSAFQGSDDLAGVVGACSASVEWGI